MYLTCTGTAASEPLTTTEAKLHLRIDHVEEDTLVASLITAARQWCEEYTRRVLMSSTWTQTLEAFPDNGEPITLARSPVTTASIVVKYYDTAGAQQTCAAATYRVIPRDPVRIELAPTKSWPSTYDVTDAVSIEFTAGYTQAVLIPAPIRQAILLLVGHWYVAREAVLTGTISKEIEFAVRALLDMYSLPEAH